MTYVTKWGRNKPQICTAEDFTARYPERLKPTGRKLGGVFTEVEADGVDKNRVEIRLTDAVSPAGHERTVSLARWTFPIKGSRDVIREMRPDDAKKLAEIDERLTAKLAEVHAIRLERADLVKRSFARGGAVLPGDLREMAEEAS